MTLRLDTIPAMLAQRSASTPHQPAFAVADPGNSASSVTWQQFEAKVARLAVAMHGFGLRKGDRIGILLLPSIEWEALHHAALTIGAVVVGLDAHDLPARLAAMVEQADITAFATPDLEPLSALSPDRWKRLCFVISLSGDVAPSAVPILGWPQLEGASPASPAATSLPHPSDVATVIFTSGTTGEPKAIAYRHDQMCQVIDAIGEAFSYVDARGRLLCWLPLSNLFQRMVNLAGLRNGATTYLLSDPRHVMAVVATVSPDVFVGVPRFFEKLLEGITERMDALPPWQRRLARWAWATGRSVSRHRLAGQPVPWTLATRHRVAEALVLERVRAVMGTRLRLMVTGSAPTPVPLLQEFHALGWLVLEAYGLSENLMPMAMNRLEAFRFGTVGKPFGDNEVRIDSEGSIRVRSSGLALPAAGLQGTPVDAEGFYATGDLGALDADGYLTLSGRANEMFKTSTGRRVSPHPAEAALRAVKGVEQAILIGAGRKCPVALCWPGAAPGDAKTLARSMREAVGQVAPHERPQAIGVVDQPFTIESGELTPNLKLRRQQIERQRAAAIDALYGALEGHARSRDETLVTWLN